VIDLWRDQPMWSFDTETTGVDVHTDRIVTAALLRLERGTEPVAMEWLADPGIEISEGAAKVHGISTEYAQAHGRPAAEVVEDILAAIEAIPQDEALVVYNVPFDWTLLLAEADRYFGTASLRTPHFVDPLVIDKALFKFRRGKGARQLMNVCRTHGVVLTEDEAHSAKGDALASARLAWKFGGLRPVSSMTLAELQGWTADKYRTQTLDFAAWKRQSDPAEAARIESEAEGWPVKPRPKPIETQDPIPF
jgi:DNA polymerase III subunit epsilon